MPPERDWYCGALVCRLKSFLFAASVVMQRRKDCNDMSGSLMQLFLFCKIGCNAKTATTCLENQENAEVGSPLNEPLSDPRCTRHNAEKVCKQSSCHQAFGIRLTSSRLDNKVKSGTSFNLRTPAQVWAFCCVMSCEALYCATTLFNTSQSTREDTCSEGVPAEPR